MTTESSNITVRYYEGQQKNMHDIIGSWKPYDFNEFQNF